MSSSQKKHPIIASADLIPRAFLLSENVVELARALIGAVLIIKKDEHLLGGLIIETEAYQGPEDQASHARNGLRSSRTETLYHHAGLAYVYLCYGIHHLFNVVTGPIDYPHAVLIRGIYPIIGMDLMLRQNQRYPISKWLNGPGKWTASCSIDRRHNGIDLCDPYSPIQLLQSPIPIYSDQIIASPRIGIDYAGEPWKSRSWRFEYKGDLATDPMMYGC